MLYPTGCLPSQKKNGVTYRSTSDALDTSFRRMLFTQRLPTIKKIEKIVKPIYGNLHPGARYHDHICCSVFLFGLCYTSTTLPGKVHLWSSAYTQVMILRYGTTHCVHRRIVCIRHDVCLMVFIVLYAYTRESTSRKGVHVKQYTFTIHEIK